MKPFSNNPAMLAGAALGFLTTAIIGWKVAERPKADAPMAAQEEPAGKSTSRPMRSSRNRSGMPEAVKQRVASIRALASPDDRMRATIELATKLPVSEIAKWMDGRWFNTGSGYDVSLFNKILKERWEKEDPEGLLAWRMKSNSYSVGETLAKWAETDPQKITAFFKEHPDRDLQLRSLAEIAKKNPEFALQCLRDMPGGSSRNGMTGYYNRQVLEEIAKASPAVLESALAALPAGLKAQAESILIGKRLETSFDSEFAKLLERPDGWKVFSESLSNGKDMKEKLFDQLANLPASWKSSMASNPYNLMDSSNAMKWWNADLEGLGFTEKDAKRIRAQALSRIASKQPEEALRMMAGGNLDSNSRHNIIANLFSNLRGDNADKAEALIAQLGTDEEKSQARQYLSNDSSSDKQEKLDNPSDWLAKIGSIDPKNGSHYQYLSMLRQWDSAKLAELGNQFRAMPDDKKKTVAQVLAASSEYSGNFDSTLVGDAIQYLVSQPQDPSANQRGGSSDPIARASQYAVRLAGRDAVAASQWVQSLPSGDARLWAQKNLGANWSQFDPDAAGQWLKTLPASERTQVEEFIRKGDDQ